MLADLTTAIALRCLISVVFDVQDLEPLSTKVVCKEKEMGDGIDLDIVDC